MLRAKFNGNYRSRKGNTVFTYIVSGTPKEIEAYKAARADNYRETDAHQPLLFTTNYNGDAINLIITTNGNVVVDTSDREKMVSIVNQTSGALQVELAKLAAARIFGNLSGGAPVVTAPAAEPAPVAATVATIEEPAGADLPE